MNTPNIHRVSWAKVAGWITSVSLSLVAAWTLQPGYESNANSLTVLTAVFSVLAGLLVAILAAGDIVRPARATWRHEMAALLLHKRDLRFLRSLLFLYLTVLALAFIGTCFDNLKLAGQVALDRGTLFLAFMAFWLSFKLPGHISRRQLDQLGSAIRARREQER